MTCSALVSLNPVNLLNLSCNNILNLCEFRSLSLVMCEGMDQIQGRPKQKAPLMVKKEVSWVILKKQ